MGAERSQWLFPRNEGGKVIGWRQDGKGLENKELLPFVLVTAYGAVANDDSIPDDDAFAAALAAFDEVIVPPGDYRLDALVEVPPRKTLRLAAGANMRRLSAYSSDTDPVICVRGRYAALIGDGKVTTENSHPEGIIVCGHRNDDASINYQGLYWRVHDVQLEGIQAPGNIGIWVPNAAWTVGPSVANYFGNVSNVKIRKSDIGVLCSEVANAHCFVGVQFWDMITSAWDFRGAYANQVLGGFLHTSTDGVVGVRLLNKTKGPVHHSLLNYISGFGIEPSGSSSSNVKIESDCTENTVHVLGNTAGNNIIENYKNDIDFGGGRWRSTILCQGTFDGSGANPAVRNGAFNVQSISKSAAGTYTVNMTTPVGNNNYAVLVTKLGAGETSYASVGTGSFQVISRDSEGAGSDSSRISFVCVGIF